MSVGYLAVSWVLLQVADTLVPALRLPDWTMSMLVFILILGLPIAALLAWVYEITPEGVKRDKDVHRDSSIAHVTGRKLDLAIIAVLTVAVIYFALDKYVLSPSQSVDEFAVNGELTVGQTSIAVLPFLNMSSDPRATFQMDCLKKC